jgi:hypothetical protein
MRLDFVCGENVQHFHSVRFEVIRDQRAMATPPDCFRAHYGGAPGSDGFPAVMSYFGGCPSSRSLSSKAKKSLDSFLELLRLHVIGVSPERRVAPRSVARVWLGFSFAAQLWEMFVTDSVRRQRFRQRVRFEPGNARTSTSNLIWFSFSNEMNSAIARVEWPMVQIRMIQIKDADSP